MEEDFIQILKVFDVLQAGHVIPVEPRQEQTFLECGEFSSSSIPYFALSLIDSASKSYVLDNNVRYDFLHLVEISQSPCWRYHNSFNLKSFWKAKLSKIIEFRMKNSLQRKTSTARKSLEVLYSMENYFLKSLELSPFSTKYLQEKINGLKSIHKVELQHSIDNKRLLGIQSAEPNCFPGNPCALCDCFFAVLPEYSRQSLSLFYFYCFPSPRSILKLQHILQNDNTEKIDDEWGSSNVHLNITFSKRMMLCLYSLHYSTSVDSNFVTLQKTTTKNSTNNFYSDSTSTTLLSVTDPYLPSKSTTSVSFSETDPASSLLLESPERNNPHIKYPQNQIPQKINSSSCRKSTSQATSKETQPEFQQENLSKHYTHKPSTSFFPTSLSQSCQCNLCLALLNHSLFSHAFSMLFLGTGINVDLNQVFHFKDNISTQPSNDTANKHNISLPRQSPSSSSLSLHKPTPATSPNTIHLNVKVLKVLLNFCVKAKTMLESPVVPTTDTQITPGDESLSSSLFFLQRDRRKAIMNQRSASNRSGSTTSGSSSAHVSDKKQSQAQSQAPSPLSPSSSPSTHNSSQHHSTDLSPSTSPTPHEHYGLSEYRPRTHTRPFQLIGGTPSAISSTSLFSLLPDVLLTKILSAAIDPLTTTSVAEGMPQQHTQLDHNSPTATLLSYRDCSALLGKDEAQMLSMLRRMIKNYCIYCQSAQKEKNISEDLDKPSLLHNSFHSLTTTTAQTTPSSSSSSSTSSSSSSSVSVTTPSPPHPNSHFTTTPSSFSATSTSAEITNTSSSSSSSSSTSSSFSSSNHTLISTDSPHPSPPQPSYLSPLCFGDNGVIVLHTLSSVCARWKTIAPSAAYLCPPHPMPLAVRLLLLLARASLSVMDCWRSERKAERQKKKEEMERKKQLKAHSHNTSNMPSMMFSSSFLSSSFSTSNQRNDEAPHILRSSFTVLPTVLLQRCLLLQLFCSFSANLLSHCLEQLDKASPVKHPPQALICASQPKPSMNSSMVIPSSSALASSPASSETSSSSSSSFNRTSDTFAIASSPSSTPPPPSEQTATQPNLLIPSVNVPSPIRKLNGYPPATLSQQSPHHSTEEVPPLPLSSGTSTIVQVIRAPNREANTSPSSPLSFFSQPDSPLSDCSPTLMSPFTSPTINSKRYSLSSKKASSVNPFSVASNVAPLGETVSLPSKYSAPLQPSNNTALNTSSMDLSSPSSSSYSSSSPPSSRNSFARGTSRPHSLAGVVPPLRLHSSTRPLSTHTNPFVGAASLADQAEYPLTSSHSRPASKRLSLSTPRSSVSVSSQMNNSSSNYATTPASEEAAATFSTQLFDATSTRPVVVTFGETVNGENENSIAESARFDRNTNEDEDTRFRSSISKIGESNTPNETPRYGSLPSSRQRLPPPFLPQKNTTSTNQNKEQVSKRPTKAVQTPSVFEGIGSTMRSGSVSSTNHATPSIETSLQPKTYNTSSSSNASNEIQRLGKKGTRELPKKSNAAHLEVEQSSTDSSGSSIESFTLKCSTDRRPNTNYRMPFSTSPITTFPTLQSVRNASSNSAALSSASASPATSTTPVTLLFPSSGGDAWAEDDTTASSKQASSDISNASSSSSSIPSSSARHSQRGRIQRIQSSRYASSNEIETDADATSMTTTTMPYQSPDSVNSNLPSETSRSTYSRMSMNSSMSLHRHRSSSLTSRTTSTNASAAPSSRLSDWHRAAVEPMTSSQPLLSSPRAPLASSRLIHSSSFDLGSSRLLSRPSTAASSALQSEATPPSNAVAANQMNYSFQIGHAGNGDMDTCTTSSSSSSSSSSSGSSIFSSSFPSITQRGKYSTRDMDAPSKGSSSRREEMERDSSSVLSPSHIFKLSRQTSRASSVWSERDSINDVDDEWLEAEQKTLMAEEEKKEEKMRLKMLVEGAPKRSEEEEMEVESESSDSSDDLSEESEDFVKSSSRFEHSSVDILSRDQFSSMHLSPSASREALNAEDPALFLRIAFPYVSSSLSSLKAEAQKMIIEMISVYQKWKRRQHNHF